MRYICAAMVVAYLTLAGCAPLERSEPSNAAPSPTTKPANLQDISAGQAVLASQLYPRLAEQAELNANLFVSPLSLSQGLGLAVLGARNETETKMRALLGWDRMSDTERLIAAYDRSLKETGDPQVALAIANSLWLDKDIAFNASYLDTAVATFGARPQKLDFGGAPQAASDRINAWVAKETRDRIKQIVSADGFDDSTAAVLTNAVWFKAKWSSPFEDNSEGEFTRGDGSTIPIIFMERIAPLRYRETNEGQAVALPYGRDGRFVMEIFLPENSRILQAWESDLRPISFTSDRISGGAFSLSAAPEQIILLRIPRFEARFNASVKPALIAAGMGCAFDAACADFSGMTAAPMAISDVAHATFLRVDEEGTEAAAVTAVTIITTGSRITGDVPKMIVDRPFLVSIRDRASGALIFFGRIADPTPAEKQSQ